MDKEAYEKRKAFAGEKKPSMLRRCVGHDYTGRQIYLITMVTEQRRPLWGEVVGKSNALKGSNDEPRVVLSELGKRVVEEWWISERLHPEIKVIALQMMPDHLHGILFVKEKMEKPLGMALRGFKQSCNKHYRELVLGIPPVASVALATRPTGQRDRRGEDREHGMLFARGYNDKLLLREGQLDNWKRYLEDNPRRLLRKREHPELFRVKRGIQVEDMFFSALGNCFLLHRPYKLQVQCSRSLTEEQIKAKTEEFLSQAKLGAVLVSPAISKGEKAIMRMAFNAGFPLIFLQENGFSDLAKPGGKRMEACARGQLLILAPWEHHNEKTNITRAQCLSLNEMARILCSSDLITYN